MAKAKKDAGNSAERYEAKKRADYAISAEIFVTEWEKANSLDEVFEALKAISEKAGRPPMPKPIILARASDYRAIDVPLKKMPRVPSRTIDVKGLTDIVMKIRGERAVAETTTPQNVAVPPELKEQIEMVVKVVLEQIQGNRKASQTRA